MIYAIVQTGSATAVAHQVIAPGDARRAKNIRAARKRDVTSYNRIGHVKRAAGMIDATTVGCRCVRAYRVTADFQLRAPEDACAITGIIVTQGRVSHR